MVRGIKGGYGYLSTHMRDVHPILEISMTDLYSCSTGTMFKFILFAKVSFSKTFTSSNSRAWRTPLPSESPRPQGLKLSSPELHWNFAEDSFGTAILYWMWWSVCTPFNKASTAALNNSPVKHVKVNWTPVHITYKAMTYDPGAQPGRVSGFSLM